jgi:hypothetical protein
VACRIVVFDGLAAARHPNATSPVAKNLLHQGDPLSAENTQELLSLWSHPTNAMVRPHIIGMFQGRMALEQTRSIRLFDRASRDLVAATNKLTKWILLLTVLATVLAAALVVATAWPYLTWWIDDGFRLH